MRITFRLILSLVAVITFVVFVFTSLQVRHEKRTLEEDLNRRSAVVAEALQDRIEPLIIGNRSGDLAWVVEKYGSRPPFKGLAVYDKLGKRVAGSKSLDDEVQEMPPIVKQAAESGEARGGFLSLRGRPVYVFARPIESEIGSVGTLAIYQSAAHIQARIRTVWKHGFLRLLLQALLISLATLAIFRWNITRPIVQAADWLKRLRLGEDQEPSLALSKDVFGPLASEVTTIVKSLSEARAAAEEEARLRQKAESVWTPERLKDQVRAKLESRPLLVISNREPYMHMRKGRHIECIMPASGLVTALEPLLRACGGTWIAHGSGEADRDLVDKRDHISVPPEDPQYSLRRVWLSKEEENGYYYGFSNEGLWPLCHIAHTRPIFRPEDWTQYQAVNERFAEIALEEIRNTEEPCILVQDYHFALLPRMIKEKRPDARVALFWHIPWPNPESFGICPWQREIIHGMLGADLLGFHIQFHCNNFLDTVDRTLECRIDWERFTVNRQDHTTWVKPFPISVAAGGTNGKTPAEIPNKAALLKELGVRADFLAVGVDRIDYTKGIVERFRGIERFLDKHPQYQGRFTFVELGAPSRTLIKRYHDLMAEVEAEVDRINWRFKAKDWKPIVFLKKHHSHSDIEPYYRAADVCLVTSLHDGMNLVAKEYVNARTDEDGTLILSRFAGASRELRDALIVNPYDSDQMAEAIRLALEMDPVDRKARMRRMRETVREHNIYRWGASLITELVQIQFPSSASPQPSSGGTVSG